MKKFFKYLFSFLLVIPFIFALTACGPTPPGEDGDKNPEFAKFSSQAVAVMSAVDMTAGDNSGGVNLSPRKSKNLMLAPSENEITTVFNMFKNHSEAESVEDVNTEYSDCLATCFTFPLGFGEIITEQFGATNFYGVKAKIDLTSVCNNVPTYATLVVENSGNTTELYMFDPSAGVGVERYSYMILTYVDKTNYTFEFVDFTEDLNNFVYAYGDSRQNFINLQKHTIEENQIEYGGYVSNGISCYYVMGVKDEEIHSYTQEIIAEKDPLVNYLGKINATKTGSQYTVNVEDIQTIFEKYVGESSEEDEAYPIYVDKNGVVQSCIVDDFACEQIVIPSKATAINAGGIAVNPSCTQVVIPDSVTSLKTTKEVAYVWETGNQVPENDPTMQEYVDAPIEYILQWFNISAGYDLNAIKPVEIVFSENNKLFKTGEDGNIYLTYGGEEYLFYINNFEAEIVQTLGYLSERAVNDFRNYSTREMSNFTYNAIEQLKRANHKFKEIVFGGESVYRDILTAENYTDTSEYVVDKVTCYGEFSAWNFYRTNGGGGFAYQEELKAPNTQKVTRIKELIIKPSVTYAYKIDQYPEAVIPGWDELKDYIDQTYPDLSYDEVLDNIIPKVKINRSFIEVEIHVNRHIQIDKITIDPSITIAHFYGYYSAGTVIELLGETEIDFPTEGEVPCDVCFTVQEGTYYNDLENYLQKFTGNVELCLPYTQTEFELLRSFITSYEDPGNCNTYSIDAELCDYVYNLVNQPNSRYTLKYAKETINLNIGSDVEKYLDYEEKSPIETTTFNNFTLRFTNVIRSLDFSKIITCATNWDFEVYKDTTDWSLENPVVEWTKLTSKVLNGLIHDERSGSSHTYKIVGTNSQTNETKEIIISLALETSYKYYSYDYNSEYDITSKYEYNKSVTNVVRDSSGKILTDHTKLPLNYGKNVFEITASYASGNKVYKIEVIRNYPTTYIEDANKTTASIYDINYGHYQTVEQNGFTVKVYTESGTLVTYKTQLPLTGNKTIYKIVVTWEGEGEPSYYYQDYIGTYYHCFMRVEVVNTANMPVFDFRDYYDFDTENYRYYVYSVEFNTFYEYEFELEDVTYECMYYLCEENIMTGEETQYAFKFVQIYD